MAKRHEFTRNDFCIFSGLNSINAPYGYAVRSRLYYTGYPTLGIPQNDFLSFFNATIAATLDNHYSVPESKKDNHMYFRGYGYSALSNCYAFGIGVEKDYEKAAALAKGAAALNNSHGINSLGILYLYGYGTEKSLEKAFICFSKAAELDCTQAIYNLGVLHLGTELSPDMKNLEKAIRYLTTAADRGFAPAQHHLATCYVCGVGVEKNLEKASKLLSYSNEQNYFKAAEALKRINQEVATNSRN